jgi:hypothetical protein
MVGVGSGTRLAPFLAAVEGLGGGLAMIGFLLSFVRSFVRTVKCFVFFSLS